MSGYLSNLLQRTFAPSPAMVQPRLGSLFGTPMQQPAQRDWSKGSDQDLENSSLQGQSYGPGSAQPQTSAMSKTSAEMSSLITTSAADPLSTQHHESSLSSSGAIPAWQPHGLMQDQATQASGEEQAAPDTNFFKSGRPVLPAIVGKADQERASSSQGMSQQRQEGEATISEQGANSLRVEQSFDVDHLVAGMPGPGRRMEASHVEQAGQAVKHKLEASLVNALIMDTSLMGASLIDASVMEEQLTRPLRSRSAKMPASPLPDDLPAAHARKAAYGGAQAPEPTGDAGNASSTLPMRSVMAGPDSASLLVEGASLAHNRSLVWPTHLSNASRQEPAQAAPTIEVTIGRIEVRGPLAAEPLRASASKPQAPSLEQYLDRRSGRSRD